MISRSAIVSKRIFRTLRQEERSFVDVVVRVVRKAFCLLPKSKHSYGLAERVLRSVYEMPAEFRCDRNFSTGSPGMIVCVFCLLSALCVLVCCLNLLFAYVTSQREGSRERGEREREKGKGGERTCYLQKIIKSVV